MSKTETLLHGVRTFLVAIAVFVPSAFLPASVLAQGITVEYAESMSTDNLQPSVELLSVAAGSVPRIVVEYAESMTTSDLIPPSLLPEPTEIAVAPVTFNIESRESTTLSATLRDSTGNPVAGKTIAWSATSGTLTPTSGTTDQQGQAVATYTAPLSCIETSVTVTSSFGGDASYRQTGADALGTIAPVSLQTSLSLDTTTFTVASGDTATFTAVLKSGDSPLPGKTIGWQATSGAFNASSSSTDSSGQATCVYTAPEVERDTAVTITASFSAEECYPQASQNATGTITAPHVNQPPSRPGNTSPANAAPGISLTPTLQSSAFSDPNAGDTHTASQWQVTTTAEDYSSPVFDSDVDSSDLTSIAIPPEVLEYATDYYWHVKHQDSDGAWSEWSVETSFTTAPNQPPNTPTNAAPSEGAVDMSVIPVLMSSTFSDSDAQDSHAASQWQVTATPGDYSSLVFDSGVDSSNLTSITIPSGVLEYATYYYWHARHQDDYGTWSEWSSETSFTTTATLPPVVRSGEFCGEGVSYPVELDSGDTITIEVSSAKYDIGIRIDDPSGQTVHDVSRTAQASFQYNAGSDGTYRIVIYKAYGLLCTDYTLTYTVTLNRPPRAPSCDSPDSGSRVSRQATLRSSPFSDLDGGDTHGASQWQITTAAGDYSEPVFDSGPDTENLTEIAVPSDTLGHSTTYYWRVRHQDSHGRWSAWSAEASFRTAGGPFNALPLIYAGVSIGGLAVVGLAAYGGRTLMQVKERRRERERAAEAETQRAYEAEKAAAAASVEREKAKINEIINDATKKDE
jgi:hypothetical protein